LRRPPSPTPLPYTTLFRSVRPADLLAALRGLGLERARLPEELLGRRLRLRERLQQQPAALPHPERHMAAQLLGRGLLERGVEQQDRKSTRLNSSHVKISYA